MAEPQRLSLPNVDAGNTRRHDSANRTQQCRLARVCEGTLQLCVRIEVVFDSSLRTARNEDQPGHSSLDRLLDGVLDERLVDDREHLLGTGLRRGKETCAAARDREHGGSNRLGQGIAPVSRQAE